MRLAIVTTHPVQYNAPWFRLLHDEGKLECRVFYTWHDGEAAVDPGFGRVISWDIPLTDGYLWELVPPSQKVQDRTFANMDSPSLLNRVSTFRPDAILVIGWNYQSHLRVMRHFHGRIPVLFRGDSTLLDRQSWIRRTFRSLALAWVFRHVDIALSVGTRNTEYFRHYGLRQDQIVLAPHAIDNDRFSQSNKADHQLSTTNRTKLGFHDNETVVLFVGKFISQKAPDDLIAAYQRIYRSRFDLQLLMVGNGPLETLLTSMAGSLPSIKFLPFQNQTEMPSIYQIGDITVLPSRSETWGLTINESMASGRAVIASEQVGANVDLIINGQTGYSCATGVDALANTLLSLPSRDSILKMGSHSCAFIQSWSFEAICQGIYRAMRIGESPVKEGA